MAALTTYLYAVALSGSSAEPKLYGPGSRPKPLNSDRIMQFEVDMLEVSQ